MALTYGIYIYPGVASLDFVGPYEVFDISGLLLNDSRVVTIAETREPVVCSNGMEIRPQYSFDDAPALDVLLVPGANDTETALASGRVVEWIQSIESGLRFLTAVCTGSLILQRTGLLSGKKATTHWMLAEQLGQDESVTVLPEMRYVRDGKVVTSQGVSAGIDMALWLIGELHSPEHSRQVRKILQYDPAPPYMAEV